jgi:predicted CXXCH cytochrome family protein
MGESLPSVVWEGVPYKINGGAFSEVKFPQPQSNCKVCHNENNANGANWKNPTRRACFTCHDDAWDLNVHMPDGIADPTPANAYSGDEVEKCVMCHGVDSTVKPVEEAHYGM